MKLIPPLTKYLHRLSSNIKNRIDLFRVILDGFSISDKTRLFLCALILQTPNRVREKISYFHSILHLIIRGVILRRLGFYFLVNALDDVKHHTDSNFEKEIRDWFTISDKGVFLDVGANIGRYAITLGNAIGQQGRVIAFEPCPETYSTLKYNIKLNNLKNVESFQIALWNTDGFHQFYSKYHAGGNSLVEDKEFIKKNVVLTRTLDGLLRKLNLAKIDLIKIDVEGAEKEVLEGMRDTLQLFEPRLIIEIREENKLFIDNFLNSKGYKRISRKENNYLYEKNGYITNKKRYNMTHHNG